MRKALIVGIDFYHQIKKLHGCKNDAYAVKGVLARHGDGSINFGIELMIASQPDTAINRKMLKQKINELFADDCSVALFYFAGHGFIENTGGYLLTSECESGCDGFPLNELLFIVNNSPARNKIIVLDCCHAGIAGELPVFENRQSLLSEGVTFLTASRKTQNALSQDGHGIFTALFVDALNGSAANLRGEITPGSIYAHIDQSLGPWQQRPMFKTNVQNFISLRTVRAPIELADLRKITDLFKNPKQEFQLNPSFEPESDEPIDDNTQSFSTLQKYNRVNLVIPVGAEHMYHAAMQSASCKLTDLGVHYWNLVNKQRI